MTREEFWQAVGAGLMIGVVVSFFIVSFILIAIIIVNWIATLI
jgi:hypothetical protein